MAGNPHKTLALCLPAKSVYRPYLPSEETRRSCEVVALSHQRPVIKCDPGPGLQGWLEPRNAPNTLIILII